MDTKAAMSMAMIWVSIACAACSAPGREGTWDSGGKGAAATAAKPDLELPAGAVLAVRLERALSTVRNRPGDRFDAILDEALVVDGTEVLARGTKLTGHVTTAQASGRLEGRAELDVTLDGIDTGGRHYPIQTSSLRRTSEAHKKRNVEMIGGGTGVGALIGGLAGGGKGAAIGAAVGAGAGTATAAATGKKEIELPAETRLQFSLKHPVKI